MSNVRPPPGTTAPLESLDVLSDNVQPSIQPVDGQAHICLSNIDDLIKTAITQRSTTPIVPTSLQQTHNLFNLFKQRFAEAGYCHAQQLLVYAIDHHALDEQFKRVINASPQSGNGLDQQWQVSLNHIRANVDRALYGASVQLDAAQKQLDQTAHQLIATVHELMAKGTASPGQIIPYVVMQLPRIGLGALLTLANTSLSEPAFLPQRSDPLIDNRIPIQRYCVPVPVVISPIEPVTFPLGPKEPYYAPRLPDVDDSKAWGYAPPLSQPVKAFLSLAQGANGCYRVQDAAPGLVLPPTSVPAKLLLVPKPRVKAHTVNNTEASKKTTAVQQYATVPMALDNLNQPAAQARQVHYERMLAQIDNHPCSASNVKQVTSMHLAIAHKLLAQANVAADQKTACERALQQIKQQISVPADNQNSLAPVHIKKTCQELQDFPDQLKQTLRDHGMNEQRIEQYNYIKKELINANQWPVIRGTMTFYNEQAQPYTLTCISTPASKMQSPDGQRIFPELTGGISSLSTAEAQYPVNLYLSDLQDEQGSTLFKCLRGGINSAFGIEDREKRETANQKRATNLVKAAAYQCPQLLNRAHSTGEAVELPIGSLALVTADRWRHTLKPILNKLDDERNMIGEELAAYQALEGQAITIPYGGTTIQIKPRFYTFCFGENKFAHLPLSRKLGASGWDIADQYNEQALQRLLGEQFRQQGSSYSEDSLVGQYLARTDVSADDRRLVRQLAHEITTLFIKKAHHKTEHAYEIEAYLSNLFYRMGYMTFNHCKSGKDRTALAIQRQQKLAKDIEAIRQSNDPYANLPALYHPRNSKKRKQAQYEEFEIATGNGNLDIQRQNTGYPGYKQDDVVIKSFYPDDRGLAYVRGLSGALPR